VKKLIFLFAFLLVGVAAAAPSVVSTTQTSATVEGLDCGSKYRFAIRKYRADGSLSTTTNYVYPQTKSCPDTQKPSAPAGVSATGATQTSISVSWNASTDNVGVAGYDLYRGGVKVGSTAATSYTFGGLSCGTSYQLAVEARDAAGNRSPASAITASTTACPPLSCPVGEYLSQYYGNMTLSDIPVLQRCETAINYDWASGSPGAAVPADRFSVRSTGTFPFVAGTYQFTATADDGIRVWVDGALLIDAWKDQAPTTYQGTTILTAGDHNVKIEYYENGGGAVAKLSWQLSQLPPTPPPPPPPAGDEPAPIAGQGYAKVFEDDFSTLNRGVWCNKQWYEGQPPAGSQEVVNGELRLRRSRTSNYANTTVSTEPCGQASPKSFKQGYFEAQIRYETAHGNGPAFWLLSTTHATNPNFPNPACPGPECLTSELDVFEGFGRIQYGGAREDDFFSGALHRNTAGFYGQPDDMRFVQKGTGLELSQHHTYAARWTATDVCWYLDGALLGCRAAFDSTNQPMHLLLYNWTTDWETENVPNSGTEPELDVFVDWVRVWQK
jgi:chitodextrinase